MEEPPEPGSETASQGSLLGLFWPLFTLFGFILVTLVIYAMVGFDWHAFLVGIDVVAGSFGASEDGTRFTVGTGFAFLGVVATILLGLAAYVGFSGSWDQIPVRFQKPLEWIVGVGMFGCVAVSVMTLFNMLVMRAQLVEALMLLCAAWMISTLGMVILRRPGVRESMATTRRERDRLLQGAQANALDLASVVPRDRLRGSRWAFWSMPAVTAVLLGIEILAVRRTSASQQLVEAALLAVFAHVTIQVGWMMTAAYPPNHWADKLASRTLRATGLLTFLWAALKAGAAGGWALGITVLLVMCIVMALCIPAVYDRVPFVRTIRRAATLRRLRVADDEYRKAKTRYDAEHPPAQSQEGAPAKRGLRWFRLSRTSRAADPGQAPRVE